MELCSCPSCSRLNGIFPSFPSLTHQPLSSHFSECGLHDAPKDAKALMDSSGRRLTSEDICLVEKMLLEGTRSHLDLPKETCVQLKILKKDLSKTCSVLYQHHFWPTVHIS
ncbi:hypothetical protein BS47DRAFT_1355961 [Hydnum rufescens UP504]|uniref:Uncharacterized protein n=1 Tax=Hydnum rufescens UP504 TaxID=1448309 RepID=A0A9P6ADQ7_9AGAM|nr:hypothetical protein BS47DRAFT_1355961 [Hydnum rufescens UP504]